MSGGEPPQQPQQPQEREPEGEPLPRARVQPPTERCRTCDRETTLLFLESCPLCLATAHLHEALRRRRLTVAEAALIALEISDLATRIDEATARLPAEGDGRYERPQDDWRWRE